MTERTVVTGLGVTTLSLLILRADYKMYKDKWEITGKPGENVMFKGDEIIVPKKYVKITHKNM